MLPKHRLEPARPTAYAIMSRRHAAQAATLTANKINEALVERRLS